MLKNISTLGIILHKKDQKHIHGGSFAICTECFNYCRSQNFQTKEEFNACFLDCKLELC